MMTRSSLPDEGAIRIGLETGSEPEVHVHSSRPLEVSRLMLGKSPVEVSEIIPLLYNVCASAQSRASLLAMQTALNQPLDAHKEVARDWLVMMENAREFLIRIFRDWPVLFEENIQVDLLPDIIQLLPEAAANLFTNAIGFSWHSELVINSPGIENSIQQLDRLIEEQVLGLPSADWLSLDSIPALMNWAQNTNTLAARSILYIDRKNWSAIGQSSVTALPEMNAAQLIKKLSHATSQGFITQPSWQGKVRETSAFTRQQHHPLIEPFIDEYGNGLMSRWIARLVELASIPDQLRTLSQLLEKPTQPVFPDASGLAQVETARGRLVHYAQVENKVISDYRIMAPTEWNFHPQGLIKQSLLDVLQRNPSSLEQALRCVINVIDPCVGYQLELD